MEDPHHSAARQRETRALEEVLRSPVPLLGSGVVLDELMGTLSRALDGAAVALVSAGAPPEKAVLASAGLDDARARALAGGARDLVRAAGDGDDARALGAAAGVRPLPSPEVPGLLGTPVPGARDVALVIVADPGAEAGDLPRLTLGVAAERAGAALELGRLRADLDRAMAQILESDERMLGRIGLDIHDGPTQHLSVALLELQLLEADLDDARTRGVDLPPALMPALERIYETLGGALTEMRELIGHLRPAQFEDRRLSDILGDAVTGFEARSGARVELDVHGEFPVNGVSVTQRITFYRILQEALNNAHRHGRARLVRVALTESEAGIALDVRDDGVGFDAEGALRPRTGAPIARFGLHGMRDRASVLGGAFRVASAPGEGTHVHVFLPRWRPPDQLTEAAA
ncbi:MAG TPA: sensor histidine kinase [Miltoncostaeaceae bacterium]|nr:sensor histidine kinase [Miltoncostaeaceae bacterium]